MQNKTYNKEAWLRHIDEGIACGPFQPVWESLTKFKVPDWYGKCKFGIFIHWGLYSVPAFNNEWYSRNMYIQGTPEFEHHVKTFGPQKEFGYKDFIPMLTAERFDPSEWIEAFSRAGARYIVPVAEHHDGFQMYASDLSCWNAAEMGPKRDILGELSSAAREKGMHFGTSSHRAEHWWFMGHGKEFDSDVKDPMELGDFYWPAMPERDNFDMESEPSPTEEYLTDWLIRTVELVDRYKPELLYFDWWIQHKAFEPYLKRFLAYYYNQAEKEGRSAAVCYKHDALAFGSGIVEVERGAFPDSKPFPWQTDTAVAWNSWCYTDSLDYKSSKVIIGTLINSVSRNGNLLLNIGPKADGTLPEGDRKILRELADWMEINHEAIYDSCPWRSSKEGPLTEKLGSFSEEAREYTEEDLRFTVTDGKLNIFVMKYPKSGSVRIRSLSKKGNADSIAFLGHIQNVRLLGSELPQEYKREDEYLEVKLLPGDSPKLKNLIDMDLPVVIQIETR